jgi:hypothetical protein
MKRRPRSRRQWRFADKLVMTFVVFIVLTGLALLIRWDLRRECIRWTTRVESTGYDAYQTSVCAEYR